MLPLPDDKHKQVERPSSLRGVILFSGLTLMAPVRLFTFTLDENPIIADGHCTECFMLRPLVYHRPSTINAAMSAALRENPSMDVSFSSFRALHGGNVDRKPPPQGRHLMRLRLIHAPSRHILWRPVWKKYRKRRSRWPAIHRR